MSARSWNVLFLCTGNSARSIIAEALLNKMGKGRFRAYSAGSQPKGQIHPETLRMLRDLGYDTSTLRSKSWEEFTRADAPQFDFILTVCDNAAAEACPVWPGKPATAHWGIADPAATDGNASEIAKAFENTYRELLARIGLLVAFPLDSLDPATIRSDLQRIGTIEGATAKAKER
jgi:arsenate reductase (thioredoxin)